MTMAVEVDRRVSVVRQASSRSGPARLGCARRIDASPWRRPARRRLRGRSMPIGMGLCLERERQWLFLNRETVRRRGIEPLARILGYGKSSDAHHITAPTVAGQAAAIKNCLADARLKPKQIDYINLHGTATKANDETEAKAVAEVFGGRGAEMPAARPSRCSAIQWERAAQLSS
jgi:acetyl-CoA acetyltransferase